MRMRLQESVKMVRSKSTSHGAVYFFFETTYGGQIDAMAKMAKPTAKIVDRRITGGGMKPFPPLISRTGSAMVHASQK